MIRFYHGLRRDVSLLMSEGHAEAHHYPVAVVWSEACIVRERNSHRRMREAAITQHVIASALDSKKVGKKLQKLLDKVADSD